jgi:hypothetical protein
MVHTTPLSEFEIDHIIDVSPLKVGVPIVWVREGANWISSPVVLGRGVDTQLVMDMRISTKLPGKYTFQLRQIGGPNLRRLDVRGSHRNRPSTGSREKWTGRTHKHRYRDRHGDGFAYTPDDIPATSAPAMSPNPGEHKIVFVAFCGECGIDEAGMWSDPPFGGANYV